MHYSHWQFLPRAPSESNACVPKALEGEALGMLAQSLVAGRLKEAAMLHILCLVFLMAAAAAAAGAVAGHPAYGHAVVFLVATGLVERRHHATSLARTRLCCATQSMAGFERRAFFVPTEVDLCHARQHGRSRGWVFAMCRQICALQMPKHADWAHIGRNPIQFSENVCFK